MATRKKVVSLSPISKAIKNAQDKLKSLESKVSRGNKKDIQHKIRELGKLEKALRPVCKHMIVSYPVCRRMNFT